MKRNCTVIIPTIGKVKDITTRLITEISEFVDEVIVFDNARQFNKKNFAENVMILRKNNEFVNPAWNKGTKIARNDYIILMNDDIIIPLNEGKFFDEIIFELNNKVFCLLGMAESTMLPFDNLNELPEEFPESDFYVCEAPAKKRPQNFGAIIAYKKDNYIPIPEELKIFFGDDYLYNFLPLKDKYTKSVGLMHYPWYHRVSSTSESVKSDTIDFETEFYGQIIDGLNARLNSYYASRGMLK